MYYINYQHVTPKTYLPKLIQKYQCFQFFWFNIGEEKHWLVYYILVLLRGWVRFFTYSVFDLTLSTHTHAQTTKPNTTALASVSFERGEAVNSTTSTIIWNLPPLFTKSCVVAKLLLMSHVSSRNACWYDVSGVSWEGELLLLLFSQLVHRVDRVRNSLRQSSSFGRMRRRSRPTQS